MLIQTDEGVLNIDHIVSVEAAAGSSHRCVVTRLEGSEDTINAPLSIFQRACGVIVPALPGFTVITALLPDPSETGIIYGEEPVIAFRIGHGGDHDGPMPITVAGEPSTIGGTFWTTRQPNGLCFGPDHVHISLDDFKAECEREVARRRAGAA